MKSEVLKKPYNALFMAFITILALLTQMKAQAVEFNFDLDGQIHDFQYIQNGLVYVSGSKNLFVKDIRNGKIIEQYSLATSYDILHV
jgi:hypothetical protein